MAVFCGNCSEILVLCQYSDVNNFKCRIYIFLITTTITCHCIGNALGDFFGENSISVSGKKSRPFVLISYNAIYVIYNKGKHKDEKGIRCPQGGKQCEGTQDSTATGGNDNDRMKQDFIATQKTATRIWWKKEPFHCYSLSSCLYHVPACLRKIIIG